MGQSAEARQTEEYQANDLESRKKQDIAPPAHAWQRGRQTTCSLAMCLRQPTYGWPTRIAMNPTFASSSYSSSFVPPIPTKQRNARRWEGTEQGNVPIREQATRFRAGEKEPGYQATRFAQREKGINGRIPHAVNRRRHTNAYIYIHTLSKTIRGATIPIPSKAMLHILSSQEITKAKKNKVHRNPHLQHLDLLYIIHTRSASRVEKQSKYARYGMFLILRPGWWLVFQLGIEGMGSTERG